MKVIENADGPKVVSGPAYDNMDWYLSNLDRLIEEYDGQYLAIHGQQVVAASHSAQELGETVRRLGLKRVLFASSHPNAMQPYK